MKILKDLKTDTSSLERIWVQKEIGRICRYPNDDLEYNEIDITLEDLQEVRIKAKKENYVNVVVKGVMAEGVPSYHHSLGDYDISIVGWRLENNEEYKLRLQHKANQLKRWVEEGKHAEKMAPFHKAEMDKVLAAKEKI